MMNSESRKREAEKSATDCASCGEGDPINECPKSERPCGHHCNHIWESDHCDWCSYETPSNEAEFDRIHQALCAERLIDPDANSDALIDWILPNSRRASKSAGSGLESLVEFHRAENAEERGEGICRTCCEPIWFEKGTIGGHERGPDWSDRVERGGDSLVCFKAVQYRHVPLDGREAAIYDRAYLRGHAAVEW